MTAPLIWKLMRPTACLIHCEVRFWKHFYTRKDQDIERYAAYLKAEEELEEQ
jgi:hypothetical protein